MFEQILKIMSFSSNDFCWSDTLQAKYTKEASCNLTGGYLCKTLQLDKLLLQIQVIQMKKKCLTHFILFKRFKLHKFHPVLSWLHEEGIFEW